MASKEQQEIALIFKDESRPGRLFFTAYDKKDRIRRALLALAICLVLGTVLIFPIIPILHIFLAIGLFIAGPLLFYKRINQNEIMEKVQGVCPACDTEVDIELEGSDRLPMWKYCPQCNQSLQINKTNNL
ncbi:hypothetical protein [Kaarinaea lacus]